MFIRAYLRASTSEQDASRAKSALDVFAAEHGLRIAARYVENESGAKLHRPELFRLLSDCEPGDVLLVEQVDRDLHGRDPRMLQRPESVFGLRARNPVVADFPLPLEPLQRLAELFPLQIIQRRIMQLAEIQVLRLKAPQAAVYRALEVLR